MKRVAVIFSSFCFSAVSFGQTPLPHGLTTAQVIGLLKSNYNLAKTRMAKHRDAYQANNSNFREPLHFSGQLAGETMEVGATSQRLRRSPKRFVTPSYLFDLALHHLDEFYKTDRGIIVPDRMGELATSLDPNFSVPVIQEVHGGPEVGPGFEISFRPPRAVHGVALDAYFRVMVLGKNTNGLLFGGNIESIVMRAQLPAESMLRQLRSGYVSQYIDE